MRVALHVTDYPTNPICGSPAEHHRQLMARLAADRDRDAFAELFDHFGPRIKAMLMKSGADHALAEDLVQDVMISVWRKVDSYAPERGTVSSWIFTIARNARIDRLRRGSSRPYEDVSDLELASDDPSAEDEILAGQRADRVGEAMADLPQEQRQVVELAFIHDISQSAIAQKLDLPLGTVKSRLRLAYGKLKTELEDIR